MQRQEAGSLEPGWPLMTLMIFDCDGVLVNSEEIYLATELEFLASVGVILEREVYTDTFMGLSPPMWQARLEAIMLETRSAPLPPDFFEQLDGHTTARIETHLAALPDARHVIDGLAARLCVASSTPSARLRWKLQQTGLIGLFDPHIFSSDMVRNGKPAPDLFLHAAAAMGVPTGECVVVEDSVNGVMAGKAAGMQVIGFTAGAHCAGNHGERLARAGADRIVESYGDLAAALERLGVQ